MENYKIIKGYLETLPVNMTIEEALNNIKKAEALRETSLEKITSKMMENVGKCYYYSDIDDMVVFTKFFVKITGTKRLSTSDRILYTATVIEVSDDTIYYLDDTTFGEGDLKDSDIVDEAVFNEALEKYKAIKKFEYKKN